MEIFLKKLKGDQEIPCFYRIGMFITMLTNAHYWSLSWVSWIQSTLSHSI